MDYVLDIQGFRRSSNIFIVKEAAIVAVRNDDLPMVYLFGPPCKWSKLLQNERDVNYWLERNFHGIPWESGAIPYGDRIKLLQSTLKDADKNYVKGQEKKKWIEEIVPDKCVIDMDNLGCPSMRKKVKPVRCCHHRLRRNPTCAKSNVLYLKNWLIENENFDDDYWRHDADNRSNSSSNAATLGSSIASDISSIERDDAFLYMYN